MFIVSGAAADALAEEPPTASELLEKFQATIDRPQQIRIDAQTNSDGWGEAVLMDTTICRDGARWKVRAELLVTKLREGKTLQARMLREDLLGKDLMSVESADFAGRTAFRVEAYPERAPVEEVLPHRLGIGSVAFGRIPYAEAPIWQIMREAPTLNVRPEMEVLDRVPTYVVESQGPSARHTLWLDPAQGYLPRRIEIDQQEAERNEGTSDSKARIPNDIPAPRQFRMALQCRFDNFAFEEHAGQLFIVQFDMVGKTTTKNGQNSEARAEYRVRSIEVDPQRWPAGSLELEMTIPPRNAGHDARFSPDRLRLAGRNNPAERRGSQVGTPSAGREARNARRRLPIARRAPREPCVLAIGR